MSYGVAKCQIPTYDHTKRWHYDALVLNLYELKKGGADRGICLFNDVIDNVNKILI